MLNLNTVTWPKIEIFKIQHGGSRHLEDRFLAITHQPIVWFQRNFTLGSRTACRQRPRDKNLQIYKIQDGGRPPVWKLLNRHISVKFGTLQQILNTMTVSWPKIEIFKIQHGGHRHLENRFYSHNSSTDCPISAERYANKSQVTKTVNFKIQDGGRPPFWNR